MLVSPCGINCDNCPFYKSGCEGCKNLKGKVFWSADFTGNGICPMYDCSVNNKNISNCGKCKDLPCDLYYNTKDPDISEEQHQKSILKRVSVLKEFNLR
ncbi:MAG: DUF3795 domain-containing protein [Bacteroidetes bacterium]|nr:DUF3795 domain-containing protein [Bacteroidota bacterium]